jgi:PAS domain S-box-containing protein
MSTNTVNEIKQKLLIIDDEVDITKALVRQFKRRYTVFSANSALEAMSILEKEDIHVIISDQRMPSMTGIEFFSNIKSKYPDIIKLVLTGFTDINNVIDAINKGQVFRYITKPWNPEELDWTINEAFEKFSLQSRNKELLIELSKANAYLEEKVKERTEKLSELNDALTKSISELKTKSNIIEAIFNSVPGIVFLYNDENKLVNWNRRHVLMTGFTEKELSTKKIYDWFNDDVESLTSIETLLNSIAFSGFGSTEVLFQKKDRSKISFYLAASSVLIDGARYFAGIGIDITDRKKAENELRKKIDEYEILQKECQDRTLELNDLRNKVKELLAQLAENGKN